MSLENILLGYVSQAFIVGTGGSNLMIGLLAMFMTSVLLWWAQAPLSVAGLIIFFEMAFLAFNFNSPGDVLLGGSSDIGTFLMLFLLVVALTGAAIYLLLKNKAQLGF